MKKEVGQVTKKECDEIQALFERQSGLNELAKIVTPDNDALYEKLVRDMGVTETRFQDWWNRMSKIYSWESSEDGRWEIDFNSCKIYLVTAE